MRIARQVPHAFFQIGNSNRLGQRLAHGFDSKLFFPGDEVAKKKRIPLPNCYAGQLIPWTQCMHIMVPAHTCTYLHILTCIYKLMPVIVESVERSLCLAGIGLARVRVVEGGLKGNWPGSLQQEQFCVLLKFQVCTDTHHPYVSASSTCSVPRVSG